MSNGAISREHALALDARDPLRHLRDRFVLPEDVIYLDGNSLGALPKTVAARLADAIDREWGRGLIRSWNDADWYRAPQRVGAKIARLIGAEVEEVIVTDSTSVDLFKVLAAALRMRPGCSKILGIEDDFPTDAYIASGVASFAGARFVRVEARDLIDTIDHDVAIVSLTHVNYKSGFTHDMRAITEAAHAKGALIVWDLSHSAGIMPLALNEAEADFAVGCGYKYLNGGPGAPAYAFVAKRNQHEFEHPLTGWLGHRDPFAFAPEFIPAEGMDKLLTGTPPILSLIALDAALDAFDGVDMAAVLAKTGSLSQLFIDLAEQRLMHHGFKLASPRDAGERGGQVSLTHRDGYAIMQALIARGVIGDYRAPDTVRFGFAPLYIRHADVYEAVAAIDDVMKTRAWDAPQFTARKPVT